MKILMINDYADVIGGAEMYMYSLKEKLIKDGNEVRLFHSKTSKDQYIKDHIKISAAKVILRLFNPNSLLEFSKTYNSFKPDIIHIHGIQNELTPSILLAIKNTPIVMTVHNNLMVNSVSILSAKTGKECKNRICPGCSNCRDTKGVFYEFLKQKIHRQLYKRISLYITPSKYMKELMEEAGFSPVQHIPNGFKLFDYSPITNFNNLLYVGRLSKEKGVEYLIRALPTVLKSHPTAKLTIVGDGSEKESLRKQAQDLGIEKQITFVPNIPHEKLEKYYQDATIVVVPSIYHDNLPTVCIEAMSVGRPLIGTSMGGIPEMIEHGKTGLIIDPQDLIQLENAINTLISDKNKLNELSLNSMKKSSVYDISLHIKNLIRIYSSQINNI